MEIRQLDLGSIEPYVINEELWVITVYYNPCGFASRRSTYDDFMSVMHRSGVNILTVECAFGDDDFKLPNTPDVIKVRSNSLLWQKERLINIGTLYLPSTCKYVAWIDCDVVFQNQNWITETCNLLSHDYTVVQLWEKCIRLGKNHFWPQNPEQVTSFGKIAGHDQTTLNCGRYDAHGHTGYAWAMRREIFDRVGLYEYAISGSADHFMAHAIYNEYGFCVENALKHDSAQIEHLKNWGEDFYKMVQGKLGCVSGDILHLWHGTQDRRDYFRRMWRITEYGYNTNTDIMALPGRPLEWYPDVPKNKPQLVAYFAEYFHSRQEDDE